jgi:hypothetical protein
VTTVTHDDIPASPRALLAGTLLGCLLAAGTCELLRAARIARAPLAHSPSFFDYGHVTLAALFMTLSFGALVVGVRLAAARAARVLAPSLGEWIGTKHIETGLRAVIGIGLPAFLLGWLVMSGTRAWTPNVTIWLLLAGALAGSAVSGLLLERLGRLLDDGLRGRPGVVAFASVALAVAGAVGFVALTEPFGLRYGKSHLVTFGLLVALASLIFTEALRRIGPQRRGRFWAIAWLVSVGVSAAAFAAPPSAAARELFYAERPTRWFGLSLSRMGPDSDGDGFERPIGFSAGQDCDDDNPLRNPEQPEILGNGIDDNCFRGDQVRPFRELFPARATPHERPASASNVLVILLDSWRFDAKSPGGVSPELTPGIAAFARESIVFDDYRTCSPRTMESFGDLFFGRLMPTFRGAAQTSAIARLTSAGVHTVDISSRFRHDHDRVSGWSKELSIPGAYGEFGDALTVEETERVLRRDIPRPFFVATHLMGAHEPYEPEPACADERRPYERYRCALRLLDRRVTRILRALSEAGLSDETVVAVSADHGEEFGEHGARFHAHTVYDEVLHVPLIVRVPGAAGETVREPVGCFDFLPTLLGAANQPIDQQLIGHDYSRGPRSPGRAQLARTRPLAARGVFEPKSLAVVVGGVKLVVDRQSGLEQYFDLRADPEERKPLARVGPSAEGALAQTMDAWLSELARQSLPDVRTASAKR